MSDLAITNSFSAGDAIVASQMNTNFTDVTTWANGAPNIGVSGSTATMDGALTVTEALTASSTSQFNGTVTVGVNDLGHDVKFFGATATNGYMLWDESTDDLVFGSAVKVGIGNTSPGTTLDVTGTIRASGQLVVQGTNSSAIAITQTDTLGGFITFNDTDASTRIGFIGYPSTDDIYIKNETDDGKVILSTANTTRVTVTAAGLLACEGAIALNGDTAAANQLDTYEEGTWSPTYISSNADMTSVVVNSSFTRGTYVRIGRQVWVNGFIRTDSIGALGSGYAIISGLPYDSYNVAGYNAYPSHVRTFFAFDADGPDIVTLGNNDNELWLARDGGEGTVDHGILATDLSTAINRNGIAFQITYITDAAA